MEKTTNFRTMLKILIEDRFLLSLPEASKIWHTYIQAKAPSYRLAPYNLFRAAYNQAFSGLNQQEPTNDEKIRLILGLLPNGKANDELRSLFRKSPRSSADPMGPFQRYQHYLCEEYIPTNLPEENRYFIRNFSKRLAILSTHISIEHGYFWYSDFYKQYASSVNSIVPTEKINTRTLKPSLRNTRNRIFDILKTIGTPEDHFLMVFLTPELSEPLKHAKKGIIEYKKWGISNDRLLPTFIGATRNTDIDKGWSGLKDKQDLRLKGMVDLLKLIESYDESLAIFPRI